MRVILILCEDSKKKLKTVANGIKASFMIKQFIINYRKLYSILLPL